MFIKNMGSSINDVWIFDTSLPAKVVLTIALDRFRADSLPLTVITQWEIYMGQPQNKEQFFTYFSKFCVFSINQTYG